MIVLGIDPGTSCGWAVLANGCRVASGVWDLRPRRHEGGGMRYLRLRSYLAEILESTKVEAVAYEEVRRHMGTDAAHIYGGIVGAATALLEEKGIPYQAVPVGTIKKRATGKGNANKDLMVDAAMDRFKPHVVDDDNEADALWCALVLHEELGAA